MNKLFIYLIYKSSINTERMSTFLINQMLFFCNIYSQSCLIIVINNILIYYMKMSEFYIKVNIELIYIKYN